MVPGVATEVRSPGERSSARDVRGRTPDGDVDRADLAKVRPGRVPGTPRRPPTVPDLLRRARPDDRALPARGRGRRAATTCCCSGRRVPVRRCSPSVFPACCPPSTPGRARGHRGALGRRHAAPAAAVDPAPVPGTRTTARRRRRWWAAGCGLPARGRVPGPPRRAVPGRGARVRAGGARRAAPAPGVGQISMCGGPRMRYPARFQMVLAATRARAALPRPRGHDCPCTPLARLRYLG